MSHVIETTGTSVEDMMETVVKGGRALSALEAELLQLQADGKTETKRYGAVEAAMSLLNQILDSYNGELDEAFGGDSDLHYAAWMQAYDRLDAKGEL